MSIPHYSMAICMSIYGCLLYASFHWSWVYLRTILILYVVHGIFWDRTAQSPAKPQWIETLEKYCSSNILFRLTSKYFSCKLHPPPNKEKVFNGSDQSYIFAYHPHGIIGMGASLALSTDASGFHAIFPGVSFMLQNDAQSRISRICVGCRFSLLFFHQHTHRFVDQESP